MMYPRIETISQHVCHGRQAERNFMRYGIAYAESFYVNIYRPNCPLTQKTCHSRSHAASVAQQELKKLKGEGYTNVVYDGRLVKL